MSYNITRRMKRAEMNKLIKEFITEAKITKKQLDKVLISHTDERVSGLKDRFDKMINLALGKYDIKEKVKESADIEFNSVGV